MEIAVAVTTALAPKQRGTHAPTTPPDRRFYSKNSAFGRLGIRWFTPIVMNQMHWHGHIELNWLTEGSMDYVFDGRQMSVPARRLAIFWAGIPHITTAIDRGPRGDGLQCNIYLPLDAFLYMPKLGRLRETLMAGGVIVLKPAAVDTPTMRRWYEDYRSGDPERVEIMKMELTALFRRASLLGWDDLLPAWDENAERTRPATTPQRYVVAMIQHIIENLNDPLSTADVAKVVGLHPNYALNLFSKTMHIPLRKFIVRMRLVRARTLLFETELPVTNIGFAAGFASHSQFHEHFKTAYGVSPLEMRRQYLGGPEA